MEKYFSILIIVLALENISLAQKTTFQGTEQDWARLQQLGEALWKFDSELKQDEIDEYKMRLSQLNDEIANSIPRAIIALCVPEAQSGETKIRGRHIHSRAFPLAYLEIVIEPLTEYTDINFHKKVRLRDYNKFKETTDCLKRPDIVKLVQTVNKQKDRPAIYKQCVDEAHSYLFDYYYGGKNYKPNKASGIIELEKIKVNSSALKKMVEDLQKIVEKIKSEKE